MTSALLLLGTLLLSQPTPSPPPAFCEVRILRDYDVSVNVAGTVGRLTVIQFEDVPATSHQR